MSWVLTIDNVDLLYCIPEDKLAELSKDNPHYRDDAENAFQGAKCAGLVSATISGGRTPSPYGGPDTVVISIVGFDSRKEGHAVSRPSFKQEMKRVILSGPDDPYMPPTEGWDYGSETEFEITHE